MQIQMPWLTQWSKWLLWALVSSFIIISPTWEGNCEDQMRKALKCSIWPPALNKSWLVIIIIIASVSRNCSMFGLKRVTCCLSCGLKPYFHLFSALTIHNHNVRVSLFLSPDLSLNWPTNVEVSTLNGSWFLFQPRVCYLRDELLLLNLGVGWGIKGRRWSPLYCLMSFEVSFLKAFKLFDSISPSTHEKQYGVF